jgi:hypothetical protein
MKYFLKNLESGDVQESPVLPVLVSSVWECGDFRVTDLGGAYEAVTVDDSPRHITVLAFRNRFKQAEKVALEIAALDPGPSAAMAQRQQAAAIRANMKDTDAAKFIDLEREDLRAGVQQMCALFQALGLTPDGAARSREILDAEIQDMERVSV